MNRNVWIGIIALIGIAGGVLWYAGTRPGGLSITGSSISLPAAGPYQAQTASYQIVANYPTSTPLTGSANDSAMALMRSFVADTISQFQNSIKGQPHLDGASTLQLVYLIGSSPRTISYIYTIDEYSGGAHGMTYFKTFVFDTTTGKKLSLADLFTPGTNYLSELSTAARAQLPRVIGPDADAQMIASGTTPDEKNFENFFIDNHNIVFLFPPYQVAAYAQGPVTLQIPTSALPGLKPQYQ